MKIAIVTWDDAYITPIDISFEDACELQPLTRVTVGFLVERRENAIVLATDHYESDGMWLHSPIVIPIDMLKEIKILEEDSL